MNRSSPSRRGLEGRPSQQRAQYVQRPGSLQAQSQSHPEELPGVEGLAREDTGEVNSDQVMRVQDTRLR